MVDYNPNSANYQSEGQRKFAEDMARFLAKQKLFVQDGMGKVATQKNAWMLGLPDLVGALQNGMWQNKFYQIDQNAAIRPTDPSFNAPSQNRTLGSSLLSGISSGASSLGDQLKGIFNNAKASMPSANSDEPPSEDAPNPGSNPIASANPPVNVRRVPTRSISPSGDRPPSVPPVGSEDAGQPLNSDEVVQKSAVNSDYIKRLIGIESGGNPYAVTGSNRGLGQFGPNEEAKYGINDSNRHIRSVQEGAITQSAEENRAEFKRAFGREPTGAELYLMHQQGQTGGVKLMQNPNEPAWKVIRPYYRSDAIAKSAISGNIPSNNPLKRVPVDDITANQFTNMWKTRWERQPGEETASRLGGPTASPENGNPGAINPGVVGQKPMNAGLSDVDAAEKDEVFPNQGGVGPKLAQATGGGLPGYTSTPVGDPITSPNKDVNSGFEGAVPPAAPLESKEQLQQRLLFATPEQRKQILDDYMKRANGESWDTATGKLVVKPGAGGAQPNVTHIQGPKAIMPFGPAELGLHIQQDPTGKWKVITPDGTVGKIGTIQDMWDYATKLHASRQDTTIRAQEGAKHYADMTNHVSNTQLDTMDRQKKLELAKQLVDDPNFISGTEADRRVKIQKFFDTLGLAQPGEGADITQAFVKFLNEGILQDIKGLGGLGLGQVRAKEMEVIQKMNPDIDMSPGAIKMLVNAMHRVNDRMNVFNQKAQDYMDTHPGGLDRGFDKEMREYYKEHPIYKDSEIKQYKELFSGKKEKTPEYRVNPKTGKLEKMD